MSTDAILNQSEPNVIMNAHSTKVNRTEPNWTEPQTCLVCQNNALITASDRAFDASAPRLWNSLPADVVASQSLATFNKRLKHFCSNTHTTDDHRLFLPAFAAI